MSLLTRFQPNLTIGLKLTLGFAILIVLSTVLGLIGIGALDRYGNSASDAASTSAIESAILAARTEEKNFLLRGDISYAEAAQQKLRLAEEIAATLADALPDDAPEQALITSIIDGSEQLEHRP